MSTHLSNSWIVKSLTDNAFEIIPYWTSTSIKSHTPFTYVHLPPKSEIARVNDFASVLLNTMVKIGILTRQPPNIVSMNQIMKIHINNFVIRYVIHKDRHNIEAYKESNAKLKSCENWNKCEIIAKTLCYLREFSFYLYLTAFDKIPPLTLFWSI